MAMAHSPRDARNRYNASFRSTIFDGPSDSGPAHFVPAGKRRDQTTSEMFGTYEDKDLRAMPKTFVPRDNGMTAAQMKQQFMRSEVLPCSNYPAPVPEPSQRLERRAQEFALMDPESEETVDSRMRQHKELSSALFGRKTPAYDAQTGPQRAERIAPTDFQWHSYPEPLRSARGEPQQRPMTHAQRAYQEKCSTVFDHRSPEAPADLAERRLKREENDGSEQQRRSNAHYSNLFGRGAYATSPRGVEQDGSMRRPKAQVAAADQIAVHQDWMDSKTELMNGPHSSRPEHPALRKSEELHHTRIFFDEATNYQPPEKLDAMTHDNSNKLRTAIGRTPQEIHQAHLRTSVAPTGFYQNAERAKEWEVMELHVSGLPSDADNGQLKKLCQGFDLHLVKVDVEIDPVRNLCQGRGKVMVRHNNQQESVAGLVRRLEESNLRVEV